MSEIAGGEGVHPKWARADTSLSFGGREASLSDQAKLEAKRIGADGKEIAADAKENAQGMVDQAKQKVGDLKAKVVK